jgi:hypothetical protein
VSDRILKQKQAFLHDPANGVYGDCYRTAIACILKRERDTVPSFAYLWDDPDAWDSEVNFWLEKEGFSLAKTLFQVDKLEDLLVSQMLNALNCPYILIGQSKNGTNHCVICIGGEIVHDPSIDNSGIVGPCDNGYYTIEYILPLQY